MRIRFIKTAASFLLTLIILFAACPVLAEKTVTLTFTGDCTIGSTELTRTAIDSFDTVATAKGYSYFFANFRELFEQDDQTIVNLEGVLSDSRNQENKTKTYRFRGPTDYVRILTGGSIEACSLANNHTSDFGKQGEETTKKTLESNGIHWFQQYTPYIYEKDGIRIAFVSFHNVWLEFDKARALISSLKKENKADAVIVCWHAGREYRGAHEPNEETATQNMINSGADLVITNHPHVIQGVTVYKDRCIFYSLGNFVFGGNNRIETKKFKLDKTVSSLYSIVVRARLTFSDDGKYLGQQITIFPTINSSGEPDKNNKQINNYQPYRANAEEAILIRDALQEDSSFRIPDITVGPDGMSVIDLGYIAAFDDVDFPDTSPNGPRGIPEAADQEPTRETKSN